MTELILMLVAGGIALLVGVAVATNTSVGGTRSDYQDSSPLWLYAGAFLMLASIGGAVVRGIQWWIN